MPNVTIRFDVSEPEDKESFHIYMNAHKMHNAIEKFSEFLHRNWKHQELPTNPEELLEIIQQKFADIFFGDD